MTNKQKVMKSMNRKPKTIEPPVEAIKSIQQKCLNEMEVKLPKKEVIAVLKKTEEAKEAEDLLKKAIDSWPSLSEKEVESFRKIYESEYGTKKKLSDYEISEAARRITIIGMMQKLKKFQTTGLFKVKTKVRYRSTFLRENTKKGLFGNKKDPKRSSFSLPQPYLFFST